MSFITHLVSKKSVIFPNILHKPFIVSTPMGESVVEKRVYRNFTIMLHNIVSYVELLELHMLDFNVILGMEWLHTFFASMILGQGW